MNCMLFHRNNCTIFILKKISEEDGQECTPLIVASRNGQEKVVRMLLAKFQLNLEEEGIVKIDGYVIDGASALWCAACAGRPDYNWNILHYIKI